MSEQRLIKIALAKAKRDSKKCRKERERHE